jgi:hypothetical protein
VSDFDSAVHGELYRAPHCPEVQQARLPLAQDPLADGPEYCLSYCPTLKATRVVASSSEMPGYLAHKRPPMTRNS